MARTGYLSSANDATSATSTTDLRTFLSSNLTTWTVGPLYTFGSATVERNYYTLSHTSSNAEILVVHPPGGATASDQNTSLLADYRAGSLGVFGDTIDRTLSFGYSPGGGYEARFVAGDDPFSDTSFWPADSSRCFPVEEYSEGNTPTDLYFFEESTHAELCIYSGRSTAGLGLLILSDALYVPTPGSPYSTEGIWSIGMLSGTGSPRPINLSSFTTWNSGTASAFSYDPTASGSLTVLTDSNQPASDGTYLTRRIPLELNDVNGGSLAGVLNNELALEFGLMTSTYATKIGPSSQPYVHVLEGLLSPWSQGLAVPTLS